jgi:DNA gyrase subunit A
VRLQDLPGITTEPFTVMNVQDDDALGWAKVTSGADEVLLATASGQAIRFKEQSVRAMGLPAGGVMGIKLQDDVDGIISMTVVEPDGYLWSITDNGLAKATEMSQYPTQGRNGQGVINVRLPKGASEVAAVVAGSENTRLIVTTALGSTQKMKLGKTAVGSRAIKPRSLIKIGERDRILGAIRLAPRLEVAEEGEETAVPKQLTLIGEEKPKSKPVRKKNTRRKK